jgi:hypothetical protein
MPGPSKKSRRLSSANGALGRHERHDSGMRLGTSIVDKMREEHSRRVLGE